MPGYNGGGLVILIPTRLYPPNFTLLPHIPVYRSARTQNSTLPFAYEINSVGYMPGAMHPADRAIQELTPSNTSPGKLQPPPSRRRDKAQLSCKSCRSRKVRCDRLRPCSNCSSRGLGFSCVYTKTTTSSASSPAQAASPARLQLSATSMKDHINQLENLVLELMHQNESSPPRKQSLCSLEPISTDMGFRTPNELFILGRSIRPQRAHEVNR